MDDGGIHVSKFDLLQLTILSSEIVKSSLSEDLNISLSCSASELPKHNFSLVLKKQNQDLGPIGYLSCDIKRPLISAIANLNKEAFLELLEVITISPPRNPSFYLKISDIKHFVNFSKRQSGPMPEIPIYDLGWRFPVM